MARFLRNLLLLLAAFVAFSSSTVAAPKKKPVTRISPAAAPKESTTPEPASPTRAPGPPGELALFAEGAIVIDAFTGTTLYEKNADARFYPASTTKIMTALLIIEAGDLERPVEVTLEDSKVGESGLDIKPGERYTRMQMLYGLLLKSANDVAHALGRDNAGTVEDFAVKMTTRAQELGAVNTSFRNPHGLHHAEHYTTARDLAIIARAAMQQPTFRKIVGTQNYDWPAATGPRAIPNHNRLLREFPGCTGVKTGFTNPAQHTFVGGAQRGGYEVISTVLRDTRQGKWTDSMLLMSYGLQHLIDAATTSTAIR
jgi:D-alanyl-D-alanine carboxypeptidase (penicillin-binding protein 5/6)